MKNFLFTIGFCAVMAFTNAQQIWYVTQIGAGLRDGTSWRDAFDKIQLQQAISQCNFGDQIWVARGIYDGIVIDIDGVEIYGGFTGNETQIDQRRWRTNPTTTIDGGGAAGARCVEIQANDCRLDGFTIRNGGDSWLAGGILVDGNYPPLAPHGTIYNTVLKNLIVHNNHGVYGSGIRLQYTVNTLIQNVEVHSNRATIEGAGFWIAASSDVSIINALVYNNRVDGGYNPCTTFHSPRGGGLFIEASEVQIINSTIADNPKIAGEGSAYGGDIFSVFSHVELNNSIVAGDVHINSVYSFPLGTSLDFLFSNNSLIGSISFGNAAYCPHYTVSHPLNISYPMVVLNSSIVGPFTNLFSLVVSPIITINRPLTGVPNPQFVSANNYRLQATSPCINTGDNSYFPQPVATQIDLIGNHRIVGANIDMGAYEYNSTAAPPNIVNGKSADGIREEHWVETGEGTNLYIYPNPVNNGSMTTIYLSEEKEVYEKPIEVKVYGIDGRLLYAKTFPYGEAKADFSTLAAGVYLLNVQTQEGVNYTQKLFINK